MIYTLTLNPSLDYIVQLDEVNIGELNRIQSEKIFPGGKGINVSRLLKRLDVDSTVLGFIGGFTGKYIEEYLNEENIRSQFVHIDGNSRINVKLKTEIETELNANGPHITDENYRSLIQQMNQLRSEDILVLSGSIPSSMRSTTYEEFIKICAENGVSVVVDTEGEGLRNCIPYQPFLIKPNHHELGGLFQVEIQSVSDAIYYGKKLVHQGAQNVIVSLAGDGAVFVNGDLILVAEVPKGEVVSSVGAGDSMVAGFLAQYTKTNDMRKAFHYGVASGTATAFSLGLSDREKIESLLSQIVIQQWEGEEK